MIQRRSRKQENETSDDDDDDVREGGINKKEAHTKGGTRTL